MTFPSDDESEAAFLKEELEKRIFDAALDMTSPSLRAAFLARWFQGDDAGRARMDELLRSSAESTSFFIDAREGRIAITREISEEFEALPVAPRGPAEGPDSWIDRYRLVRRIGEGSGGVVYEAEQFEPLRREVALKIIRLGMDTEAVIARFGNERQALARMDHPHIAKVFDAGATHTGRPYFVMELVKGPRITSWCDGNRLDVRRRLELFLQICDAIQHAHQKGIVHRDIKPSNILIQTAGDTVAPKVIDFGIAKATGERASSGTRITERDQMIGTPSYMSPEQVDLRGIDIDTRSDVYSLGALLYELLAGVPPFDGAMLGEVGMSEMRRILLEDEPSPPSRRLAAISPEERLAIARARRTDPERLAAGLRGDLDAIVSMALEKDRDRRYQTVGGLAADVCRVLAHQPVNARRAGSFYLTGKFIRRNRVACASGLAVAISLFGALGVSTWLYLRERDAYAVQEELRWVAEAARSEEARMRSQAQARANLSQVAVLLSQEKIAEADALLRENPLDSIEPSIEAAQTLDALGHWNAVYERWDQVLHCFRLLQQANRFSPPAKIARSSYLITLAPVLYEHGEEHAYESFRQEALRRYQPVVATVSAEHLLKVCLLKEADEATLRLLDKTAAYCEKRAFKPTPDNRSFPEWNSFSLALYYLRTGDFPRALSWCDKGLSISDRVGARKASTLAVRALACHGAGQRDQAVRDLAAARALVPTAITEEMRFSPAMRFWWDWMVARILLREAEYALAPSS